MQQQTFVDLRASPFAAPYAELPHARTRQACAEYIRRLAGFAPNSAVVVKQQTIEKLIARGALGEAAPHHVTPFGLYILARTLYPLAFRDLLVEAEAVGHYGEAAPDFHERVYAELRRVVAAKQGTCAPDDFGVEVIVID